MVEIITDYDQLSDRADEIDVRKEVNNEIIYKPRRSNRNIE